MNRVRPYLPLLGFVLPTVIVGYGIVIPRSCIAGVNELTVGFGTTLLGAVFTYVAGQRAMIAREACSKPPVLTRLTRAINRQAASPSGWFGRLLGSIWRHEHRALNVEVLDQLDVREGHHVLEVGSGPGDALAMVSKRTSGGRVVGVDVSELMAATARRRNRRAVARGEVDVRVGDIESLHFDDGSFDRIFSVHCIYFWSDVDAVVAKLGRALRPAGRLLLAFRPESDDIPQRFRDPTYRFPRVAQVEAALERAGLIVERTGSSTVSPKVVLVTASKSTASGLATTGEGAG
jgi:SAM-dependent methyltransferase